MSRKLLYPNLPLLALSLCMAVGIRSMDEFLKYVYLYGHMSGSEMALPFILRLLVITSCNLLVCKEIHFIAFSQ